MPIQHKDATRGAAQQDRRADEALAFEQFGHARARFAVGGTAPQVRGRVMQVQAVWCRQRPAVASVGGHLLRRQGQQGLGGGRADDLCLDLLRHTPGLNRAQLAGATGLVAQHQHATGGLEEFTCCLEHAGQRVVYAKTRIGQLTDIAQQHQTPVQRDLALAPVSADVAERE